MATDIQIAQLSRLGAIAYILASIIVIVASNKTEQAAVCSLIGGNNSSIQAGPTTEEMIATASFLFLIGNLIFLYANILRLEAGSVSQQKSNNCNSNNNNNINNHNNIRNDSQSSSDPNRIIVVGWIISVIGSTLRTIGNEQKASQS